MTQTRDLIKKMADFFTGEEFYEKGEDARLELSPDDVRCMNEIIKACGNAISRQAVLDTIHLFFTEEIDKIPTKKTEDGEVLVIHKCQPLLEMNKAICKRIKTLPSASPTQNCVGNALDMRCDDAISRQAVNILVDELARAISDERCCISRGRSTATIMQNILDLPSVNPQEPRYYPPCEDCHNKMNEIRKAYDKIQSAEPKTGHWIKYGIPRCDEQHYKCTACGYYINFGQWGELYTKQFNYCPNCGARMVEPQKSENCN